MDDPRQELLVQIDAARAGSKDALGKVLENSRAYLLTIANRSLDDNLRAKGGASDIVQETFLEAQRDFRSFQGRTEAELLGWLQRMLQNNLANFARHYRQTDKRRLDREVVIDPGTYSSITQDYPAADTPTPSVAAMADEESQVLTAAIGRLPDDYRTVLTLRYLHGQSFEEIAGELQRSNNAVRQLWSRAVFRLRQELEQA